MDKEKIIEFSKIIASIQKEPEQKKQFESCQSLDDIHDFIKTAYPQYSFSKEELELCFTALACAFKDEQEKNFRKLNDEQMEISGGKMPYEDARKIDTALERIKGNAQLLKKGAAMGNLMSELMGMLNGDNMENFDMGEIMRTTNDAVQKMFSSTNSDRFTTTGAIDSSNRLDRSTTRTVKDYSSRSSFYDDSRIGRTTHDLLAGREERHRFKDMGQV